MCSSYLQISKTGASSLDAIYTELIPYIQDSIFLGVILSPYKGYSQCILSTIDSGGAE